MKTKYDVINKKKYKWSIFTKEKDFDSICEQDKKVRRHATRQDLNLIKT